MIVEMVGNFVWGSSYETNLCFEKLCSQVRIIACNFSKEDCEHTFCLVKVPNILRANVDPKHARGDETAAFVMAICNIEELINFFPRNLHLLISKSTRLPPYRKRMV